MRFSVGAPGASAMAGLSIDLGSAGVAVSVGGRRSRSAKDFGILLMLFEQMTGGFRAQFFRRLTSRELGYVSGSILS